MVGAYCIDLVLEQLLRGPGTSRAVSALFSKVELKHMWYLQVEVWLFVVFEAE